MFSAHGGLRKKSQLLIAASMVLLSIGQLTSSIQTMKSVLNEQHVQQALSIGRFYESMLDELDLSQAARFLSETSRLKTIHPDILEIRLHALRAGELRPFSRALQIGKSDRIVPKNITAAVTRGSWASLDDTRDGKPTTTVFVPVRIAGRSHGALELVLSAAARNRRIWNYILRQSLYSLVVLLIAMVVCTWATDRWIVRRIIRLERKITAYGAGTPMIANEADAGSDEISVLSEAFTQMESSLAERAKIHSMLQKVVSKEIAQELLSREALNLGGEDRVVSVLFTDFRSFTTLSESFPPEEVLTQLNAFFTGMSRAIDRHHGVIDKYMGDGLMALFGAPLTTADDPANAIRAALAMVAEVNAINEGLRANGQPIWRQGIGINTGTVIAGALGGKDRWSYTVIGDAVNIASRLTAVTKKYDSRIVVTNSTREAAGSAFIYRLLDRIMVRGRTEPLDIYEVIGEGATPPWVDEFHAALGHFRAGRWADARLSLRRVLADVPSDVPSTIYMERIQIELSA